MKKRPKKLYQSIQGRTEKRMIFWSFTKIKRVLVRIILNKMVLAVFAGLVVGSFFGLTSLHLLTDTDDTHVFQEQPFSKNQTTQTSSADTLTSFTLDIPSVYVIQVGLFHERENAELRKRQLERGKIVTFIWQRGEEFFLLHSLHSDETKAKQVNEQLSDESVDAFVKKWDMPEVNKQITSDEQQFVEQFIRLWEQSLQKVELGEAISIEKWKDLHERENDSTLISTFQLKLEDIMPNLQNEKVNSIALLQLLFLLEKNLS